MDERAMKGLYTTRPEEALAILETPYGHASSFLELSDGRILQNVRGGGFVHSEDGGLTWTQPKGGNIRDPIIGEWWVQYRDTKGNPVGGGGTALVKLSGKNSIGLTSVLFEADASQSYAQTPTQLGFQVWRSDDNGETWSEPVRMTAPGCNTGGYLDNFLRTSSGRIVLPVFHHFFGQGTWENRPKMLHGRLYNNQFVNNGGHYFDPAFGAPYVLYSDDDGRTWKRNKDGELTVLMDWNAMFSIANEGSVTEVAPGRLLLMMRTQLGRLFQAWSNDNGETWTKPQPTILASSTCPCQIRTLPNGHLLCVWNQENEDEVRRGYNRTRVSTAISRDGGRVWEFFQNLGSAHPTTRVEPGPIRLARPEELYSPAGHGAVARDPLYVEDHVTTWRGAYPCCLVMKDRVLITHTSTHFEEHPTEARMINLQSNKPRHADPSRPALGLNQRLFVLPLSWFYGGKQPADNPFLKTAYEPAKP